MNKDTIKGHWKEIKGNLKQKWGDLTDNDMDRISGRWEELEGILQQKYGESKENIQKEIKSFEDNIRSRFKD